MARPTTGSEACAGASAESGEAGAEAARRRVQAECRAGMEGEREGVVGLDTGVGRGLDVRLRPAPESRSSERTEYSIPWHSKPCVFFFWLAPAEVPIRKSAIRACSSGAGRKKDMLKYWRGAKKHLQGRVELGVRGGPDLRQVQVVLVLGVWSRD